MEKRSYLASINKYDSLGVGAFSRVFMCDYFDYLYAYKEFLCEDEILKVMKTNIEKLTGIEENGLILPYKLIYEKKDDDLFKGYIMDYLYNYDKLDMFYHLSYDKKIEILKRVRKYLDLFHEKYNMIHADISPWNIMYNEKMDDIKLIDFDLCIDLKDMSGVKKDYMNEAAEYYAKCVGIDKDLDIFIFNLTTYSILNNSEFFNSFDNILENNNYGMFENQHIIDILKGYKNIENTKVLKKEYIIDYL